MPTVNLIWGQTVEVTKYAEIYISTAVVAGQHLGLKLSQQVAYYATMQEIATLSSISLDTIAVHLEDTLGVIPEYITLSCNLSDPSPFTLKAKITDFQLSIVCRPQQPISAALLMQELTSINPLLCGVNRGDGTYGALRLKPLCYALDTPTAGGGMFHYEWKQTLHTEDYLNPKVLQDAGLDIEILKNNIKTVMESNLIQEFVKAAAEKGYNFFNCSVTVNVRHTTSSYGIKLYTDISLKYDSDVALMGSPLHPAVIPILSAVISAIVTILIAYFAIQAIKEWLQSMTTKTETSEEWSEIVYYDPNTGQPIKTERTYNKDTKTEPDWIPIIIIVGILGIGALVASGLLKGQAQHGSSVIVLGKGK